VLTYTHTISSTHYSLYIHLICARTHTQRGYDSVSALNHVLRLVLVPCCPYTSEYLHTRMHTQLHTRSHTRTHTCTHTYTCTYTRALTQGQLSRSTHSLLARRQAIAAGARNHAGTCLIQASTYTHACTHRCIHAHTHIHTRTRTHIHIHIHTQGQFSRSMHPLLAEVGSWQQEPKLRAALLLRTLLVLGEDALHQYLQHLVPAFCK